MAGEVAPYLDGVPIVADAATREVRFPIGTRSQNQRVYRIDTGTVERWSGSAWVDVAQPALPAGGRATTTLATYLANNASYNPLDYPGVDFGAKVAAALADLPAAGGTIDARNVSGAQTMSADLIINKSNVSLLLGSMQLTSAFSIKVPSPISNVKIAGIAPIGSVPSGLVNGTYFVYTGTGSAIAMGDSSATSYNHLLENVSVSISGAGSAAVGIDSTRVYHAVMNYVRVIGTIGVTTQIGIRNNGTATAPGSQNLLIVSPYISNVFTGIQTIAGGSGSPLANMNQIVGGELTGSSASTAGSIGIDIQNGNNNNFYGVTISNYETGLKVSSASGRAVYGDVHVEACTTAFNFTAASSANWLFTDTANPIVDNGAGNTVIGNGTVVFTANGFLNRWRNLADNAINLVVQPGLTVEQQGLIAFKNFAGVTKWNQGKLSDNSHALQDGSGNNIIVVGPNTGSQLALNAPFGGAGSIDINSTSGTGTTGLRVYSGGASPQLIAQFNGGATPLCLLSQPVNKAGEASIVADSSAINTTETVIVKSTALVASRLKAGTVIRAILSGTCTATVGNTSTFQIRIGVNGTTADALVFSGVTAVSATTGTNVPFRATLELTVRTVGASSTAIGVLTIETTGGTATGIATVPLQVILPTMTTFDSTLANIVSVTYQSAATTTTSTFKNGFIEVVYQ